MPSIRQRMVECGGAAWCYAPTTSQPSAPRPSAPQPGSHQPGWPTATVTAVPSDPPRAASVDASKGGMGPGVIGAIVGIPLVLGVVGLLVWFLFKRYNDRKMEFGSMLPGPMGFGADATQGPLATEQWPTVPPPAPNGQFMSYGQPAPTPLNPAGQVVAQQWTTSGPLAAVGAAYPPMQQHVQSEAPMQQPAKAYFPLAPQVHMSNASQDYSPYASQTNDWTQQVMHGNSNAMATVSKYMPAQRSVRAQPAIPMQMLHSLEQTTPSSQRHAWAAGGDGNTNHFYCMFKQNNYNGKEPERRRHRRRQSDASIRSRITPIEDIQPAREVPMYINNNMVNGHGGRRRRRSSMPRPAAPHVAFTGPLSAIGAPSSSGNDSQYDYGNPSAARAMLRSVVSSDYSG